MIGERIKEERERLGLTQPAFAAVAGAAKRTLIEWEKGSTSPTAVQLSALVTVGVDILYILTGVRSTQALNQDEQELIEAWRGAPLAGKAAAIAALTAGSEPKRPERGAKISITGRGKSARQVGDGNVSLKATLNQTGNGNVFTQTTEGEKDGSDSTRGKRRR